MKNLIKMVSVISVVVLSGCSSSPTPPPPCDISANSGVKASFSYATFGTDISTVPCNARRPINTSI